MLSSFKNEEEKNVYLGSKRDEKVKMINFQGYIDTEESKSSPNGLHKSLKEGNFSILISVGSISLARIGKYKKEIFELKIHEKLAILFSTVLIGNNHLDSALKVIEQYALDWSTNKLSHANAFKLKTILMLEEESESFINIKACCDLALKKVCLSKINDFNSSQG